MHSKSKNSSHLVMPGDGWGGKHLQPLFHLSLFNMIWLEKGASTINMLYIQVIPNHGILYFQHIWPASYVGFLQN